MGANMMNLPKFTDFNGQQVHRLPIGARQSKASQFFPQTLWHGFCFYSSLSRGPASSRCGLTPESVYINTLLPNAALCDKIE